MAEKVVSIDEKSLYQSIIIDLDFGEETKRCNLEIRYLEKTGKWYIDLFDMQTGETYLTKVPLLASYGEKLNNLWKPFSYKDIGVLVCVPNVSNPSSEDPDKKNVKEFLVVWSDLIVR